MTSKPFLTGLMPALLGLSLGLSLYLHETDSTPAKRNSDTTQVDSVPTTPAGPPREFTDSTPTRAETDDPALAETEQRAARLPTMAYFIHGRVSDENNRPLADVLVSDEMKFGSVRSDRDGRYQIIVAQPKFKTPLLNFLRQGYRENRIGIATHNSPAQTHYEINVTLKSADNSTNLEGWIGNDLGEGLGGRKISIRAQAGQGAGNIFYAVISDPDGRFWFEGIRSGIAYKLAIEPSADYAGYKLEPLPVSQQTPRLNLVLERLNLVDIEGLIVDTDSAPVSNFDFNVQNLSLDHPDRNITSDSSGFFKLADFPTGELKFSTHPAQYFKITGLHLRHDNNQNLQLMIDKGNFFLSGWISDANGAPVADARVTLSARFTHQDYQSYSQRSMKTDSSGEFRFANLGRVDHLISVHASGYLNRSLTHRFRSFADHIEIKIAQ